MALALSAWSFVCVPCHFLSEMLSLVSQPRIFNIARDPVIARRLRFAFSFRCFLSTHNAVIHIYTQCHKGGVRDCSAVLTSSFRSFSRVLRRVCVVCVFPHCC